MADVQRQIDDLSKAMMEIQRQVESESRRLESLMGWSEEAKDTLVSVERQTDLIGSELEETRKTLRQVSEWLDRFSSATLRLEEAIKTLDEKWTTALGVIHVLLEDVSRRLNDGH